MNKKSEHSKAQQGKSKSAKSDAVKSQDEDLSYSSKYTEESAGLTPDENQKSEEPEGGKDD